MGTMMGTGKLRHKAIQRSAQGLSRSSCSSETRTAGSMSTCSVLGGFEIMLKSL